MRKRSIRRLNCIYGEWMYPDPKTGPERLTLAEVAARYASETERRTLTPDSFARLSYIFIYDNPEQAGQHGVPGTMHLRWTLRNR